MRTSRLAVGCGVGAGNIPFVVNNDRGSVLALGNEVWCAGRVIFSSLMQRVSRIESLSLGFALFGNVTGFHCLLAYVVIHWCTKYGMDWMWVLSIEFMPQNSMYSFSSSEA